MIRNDNVSYSLHYYSKDKWDVVPSLEKLTPRYGMGTLTHFSSVERCLLRTYYVHGTELDTVV